MRKTLILFTLAVLSLLTFDSNAEQPVRQKIPLEYSKGGIKLQRNLSNGFIEACYNGMMSAVYTFVSSDLGEIDVTVTNCSTGEFWEDTFDSSSISQHLLPISSTPGLYEVTYTTTSGDLYEGTFMIE